jgi:hypothetical protein
VDDTIPKLRWPDPLDIGKALLDCVINLRSRLAQNGEVPQKRIAALTICCQRSDLDAGN